MSILSSLTLILTMYYFHLPQGTEGDAWPNFHSALLFHATKVDGDLNWQGENDKKKNPSALCNRSTFFDFRRLGK